MYAYATATVMYVIFGARPSSIQASQAQAQVSLPQANWTTCLYTAQVQLSRVTERPRHVWVDRRFTL